MILGAIAALAVQAAMPASGDATPYLPEQTVRDGVRGVASLYCQTDAEGRPEGCRAMTEEPTGRGFGEAAVRMAPLFRGPPNGDISATLRFDPPVWRRQLTTPPFEGGMIALAQATLGEYPKAARKAGVEGGGVLRCVVGDNLRLADCSVEGVKPEGQGFEEAILRGARKVKVLPTTPDGAPTPGALILLPVGFRLPR